MKLSIIIVNWNTSKLLRQCLNSLEIKNQKSKIKNNFEIIVVDNGSTDDSIKEIETFKFQIKNFKLKIIQNDSNQGFAKAVNMGIKESKGEVILLLNSDTQVKPGALEKLIEFEEKVRPAVIGAKMLNLDGTVQGSCFNFPTVKRAILEYWLGKKNYFSKYAPTGNEAVEVEAVSGGAMLISREIINKIGMLDEQYFFYFEDLEFCRRTKKAGFKVYYLPSAEVFHEHGASGKNLVDSKDQWKRLIPSAKIYYGLLKYFLMTLIIWLGQKMKK